jgi:hypothetical protein
MFSSLIFLVGVIHQEVATEISLLKIIQELPRIISESMGCLGNMTIGIWSQLNGLTTLLLKLKVDHWQDGEYMSFSVAIGAQNYWATSPVQSYRL